MSEESLRTPRIRTRACKELHSSLWQKTKKNRRNELFQEFGSSPPHTTCYCHCFPPHKVSWKSNNWQDNIYHRHHHHGNNLSYLSSSGRWWTTPAEKRTRFAQSSSAVQVSSANALKVTQPLDNLIRINLKNVNVWGWWWCDENVRMIMWRGGGCFVRKTKSIPGTPVDICTELKTPGWWNKNFGAQKSHYKMWNKKDNFTNGFYIKQPAPYHWWPMWLVYVIHFEGNITLQCVVFILEYMQIFISSYQKH